MPICQFREHRRNGSHSLLSDLNESVSVLVTFMTVSFVPCEEDGSSVWE